MMKLGTKFVIFLGGLLLLLKSAFSVMTLQVLLPLQYKFCFVGMSELWRFFSEIQNKLVQIIIYFCNQSKQFLSELSYYYLTHHHKSQSDSEGMEETWLMKKQLSLVKHRTCSVHLVVLIHLDLEHMLLQLQNPKYQIINYLKKLFNWDSFLPVHNH